MATDPMDRPIVDLDAHPLAPEALANGEILYTDLDGTLLGPGGALLVDAAGGPSLAAAAAVVEINRAGLTVVPCTGRNRFQVHEIARMCDWSSFIAELGCVMVPGRGAAPVYFTGEWDASALRAGETPFAAIERAGALDVLREAFPGRIEHHAPWHVNREATHVLRGNIDVAAARRLLGELDLPIDIVDNGVINPPATTLTGVSEVHAYHLLPAGVTKAGAVATDRERRGIDSANALAIGDSATDVQMAEEVALCVMVGQSARDERVLEAAEGYLNVAVTRSPKGEGWAEFAAAWLAARA